AASDDVLVASLAGRVVDDRDAHAPISRVQVAALANVPSSAGGSWTPLARATTGEDGSFVFHEVRVPLVADESRGARRPPTVLGRIDDPPLTGGEFADLRGAAAGSRVAVGDVIASACGTVRGRVLRSDGSPAGGALVLVRPVVAPGGRPSSEVEARSRTRSE